jgi:hypothetical protein
MSFLSPAMAGTLAAVVWCGVFVVAQWLIAHWLSPSRRGRVLWLDYGACCVGLAATVWVLGVDGRARLLGGIFALMTFSCLLVLYMPAYYVLSNSLSVQSIITLLEHRGRMTLVDLQATFASRELLRGRLETMVQSGLVEPDPSGFRITRRGRRMIAPFLALKSLWRLGPGG